MSAILTDQIDTPRPAPTAREFQQLHLAAPPDVAVDLLVLRALDALDELRAVRALLQAALDLLHVQDNRADRQYDQIVFLREQLRQQMPKVAA